MGNKAPSAAATRAAQEVSTCDFESCGEDAVLAAAKDIDAEIAPLLEALKVAERTLLSLNGKVDYQQWQALYDPVRQISDAIARAESF